MYEPQDIVVTDAFHTYPDTGLKVTDEPDTKQSTTVVIRRDTPPKQPIDVFRFVFDSEYRYWRNAYAIKAWIRRAVTRHILKKLAQAYEA